MIDRSRRHPRALWTVLAFCMCVGIALCVIPAPTVCAQGTQQTALARSLFEQGVAAADAGQWADAADRFERAYGLKPTTGIAFNWASALIELGRLVEAGERLRSILRDPAVTPEVAAEAQGKLDLITPRIASLVVHVQGPKENVSVAVDGNALPEVAWGAGSPTDPGSHTITLARGTETLNTEAIVLADGERRELELTVPELAPVLVETPVVPPPPPPPQREEPERRPLYKNWMVWTAVGVVVAAGAVTTALLLSKDDPSAPAPIKGDTDPAVIRW